MWKVKYHFYISQQEWFYWEEFSDQKIKTQDYFSGLHNNFPTAYMVIKPNAAFPYLFILIDEYKTIKRYQSTVENHRNEKGWKVNMMEI